MIQVRRLAALMLVAGAAVSLVETVGATQSALRVIARKSASGDSAIAIAIAGGQANKPTALYLRVLARPNQRVSANWTMVCSKGLGAGSKSGSFSSGTPVTRRLRMPMTRPSGCVVSGSAQLRRSGRVTVLLLKQP